MVIFFFRAELTADDALKRPVHYFFSPFKPISVKPADIFTTTDKQRNKQNNNKQTNKQKNP